MAVHDIGYVELYTRDKVSMVNHLVSAMGFTRVADSVAAERSSVLLQQGRVRLAGTSGRGRAVPGAARRRHRRHRADL